MDRLWNELVSDQTSLKSKKNMEVKKEPIKGRYEEIMRSVSNIGLFERKTTRTWKAFQKFSTGRGGRSCLPCYAASHINKCCNTCRELQRSYLKAGLPIEDTHNKEQCIEKIDGCSITASINLNIVEGMIHIAAGDPHSEQNQRHHHHWDPIERKLGYNSSFIIHELEFGDQYPGIINPLEDTVFIEKNDFGQQNYYLKLVPTIYKRSFGRWYNSYQYSVSEHHQVIPVDPQSQSVPLPGLYIRYDIDSIQVLKEEVYVSLGHLLTRLCAIIGGIYVTIGIVYTTLRGIIETILKTVKSL